MRCGRYLLGSCCAANGALVGSANVNDAFLNLQRLDGRHQQRRNGIREEVFYQLPVTFAFARKGWLRLSILEVGQRAQHEALVDVRCVNRTKCPETINEPESVGLQHDVEVKKVSTQAAI